MKTIGGLAILAVLAVLAVGCGGDPLVPTDEQSDTAQVSALWQNYVDANGKARRAEAAYEDVRSAVLAIRKAGEVQACAPYGGDAPGCPYFGSAEGIAEAFPTVVNAATVRDNANRAMDDAYAAYFSASVAAGIVPSAKLD